MKDRSSRRVRKEEKKKINILVGLCKVSRVAGGQRHINATKNRSIPDYKKIGGRRNCIQLSLLLTCWKLLTALGEMM